MTNVSPVEYSIDPAGTSACSTAFVRKFAPYSVEVTGEPVGVNVAVATALTELSSSNVASSPDR